MNRILLYYLLFCKVNRTIAAWINVQTDEGYGEAATYSKQR